jgi:DDE superfamily endonuclease
MRVEHEYARMGAWVYLAAWDVRRAKIYGRYGRKTGIVPFERLVDQVMHQEHYCSASCVFWIMDNGSSHRDRRCSERLCKRWPSVVVVHTPVHASWLNQVEIYFSIVQRKALTPSDFRSLVELEDHLLRVPGALPILSSVLRVEVHAARPKQTPGPVARGLPPQRGLGNTSSNLRARALHRRTTRCRQEG